MMIVFFIVVWTLRKLHKKESYDYLLQRWHVSILSILYFYYIDLTRNLLGIFNCTHVDRPEDTDLGFAIAMSKYWVQDPSLKCYEDGHLVLLLTVGIPLLVLVSIGMPLRILITLSWRINKLKEKDSSGTYRFLYCSYTENCKYWEVLVMLRKSCLAIIAVLAFSLGPDLQATLAMGVLFIAICFHLWKSPFVAEGPNLNRLESISISCSFLVFAMGTVFNGRNTSSEGKIVASVVLCGSLIGVTLFLLLELMRELAKRFDKSAVRRVRRNG